MSDPSELGVDTNILMDAVKGDDASDVEVTEIVAAREVGALLLTKTVLVYSKKILQEWQAKGLWPSNKLLADLARLGRLKMVSPAPLRRAEVEELREYVDGDDQPFVLAASTIQEKPKVLVTRDPKTTRDASRRYVKKTFSVIIKTASEFVREN